jgi:hypothetical protein
VSGFSKSRKNLEAVAAPWSENLVMLLPIEKPHARRRSNTQLWLQIVASCNRLSDAAAIADMEDVVDFL